MSSFPRDENEWVGVAVIAAIFQTKSQQYTCNWDTGGRCTVLGFLALHCCSPEIVGDASSAMSEVKKHSQKSNTTLDPEYGVSRKAMPRERCLFSSDVKKFQPKYDKAKKRRHSSFSSSTFVAWRGRKGPPHLTPRSHFRRGGGGQYLSCAARSSQTFLWSSRTFLVQHVHRQ